MDIHTNTGIQLSFDDDIVETYIPNKEEAFCLAKRKCSHIKLVQKKGYKQLFCSYADTPVFDLYRSGKGCPLRYWYKSFQSEEDLIQTTFSVI